MFTLYRLGAREAVIVSIVRIILVSLLFGNPVSMLYGLGGAVVCLCLMLILKRFSPLSPLGVSVAGGVAHNAGQIAVACIILGTAKIAYYMPFLVLSGTVAGIVVGVASGILIKRVNKR
jgi:heptaprenyl diphosphate synthase